MGTISVHVHRVGRGVREPQLDRPVRVRPRDGRDAGRHHRVGDGLVDALHLFVYPVAVGAGAHLWADGVDPTRLRLQDHARYANGVVYLNYGPA